MQGDGHHAWSRQGSAPCSLRCAWLEPQAARPLTHPARGGAYWTYEGEGHGPRPRRGSWNPLRGHPARDGSGYWGGGDHREPWQADAGSRGFAGNRAEGEGGSLLNRRRHLHPPCWVDGLSINPCPPARAILLQSDFALGRLRWLMAAVGATVATKIGIQLGAG